MVYVDGFVIPIPKKNLAAYRRMARSAGKVWKEYGALDYKECVGDDLTVRDPITGKKASPFPRMARLKPGEKVLFSYIVYKSCAHRDRVNAKVMDDPRIARMMDEIPFDTKRMAYGGFRVLVDL
jgi:uncharacterized protein YbaA (DUF1428 family)